MPDVVVLCLHAINRIQQVDDAKNVPRDANRDEEQIQVSVRFEQNRGVQNPGHRTRRTNGPVAVIVLVHDQREQAPENQTRQINQQEGRVAQINDDRRRKKIQREHVEKQMPDIGVQESRSNHADLVARADAPDVELVFSEEGQIVKTLETDHNIGSDKDQENNVHVCCIWLCPVGPPWPWAP